MRPMGFKPEFSFPSDQKQVSEPMMRIKIVKVHLLGTYCVPGTMLNTGYTVANNQMLIHRLQCLLTNEKQRETDIKPIMSVISTTKKYKVLRNQHRDWEQETKTGHYRKSKPEQACPELGVLLTREFSFSRGHHKHKLLEGWMGVGLGDTAVDFVGLLYQSGLKSSR